MKRRLDCVGGCGKYEEYELEDESQDEFEADSQYAESVGWQTDDLGIPKCPECSSSFESEELPEALAFNPGKQQAGLLVDVMLVRAAVETTKTVSEKLKKISKSRTNVALLKGLIKLQPALLRELAEVCSGLANIKRPETQKFRDSLLAAYSDLGQVSRTSASNTASVRSVVKNIAQKLEDLTSENTT